MLDISTLPQLKNAKNLLAFSAGGDSTALFFLLLEAKIKFDIAIIDYGVREQSKDEVAYAKELSKTYAKECYVFSAGLIKKNFEAEAREIRYGFFHKLIKEFDYDNLLTAHHLGDRLEWMLMQFCRGAGCVEMAGMQNIQKRDNYTLIRPLLAVDKSELLEFLHSKDIRYFEDESNFNKTIKRNLFRHNFSAPLLAKYKEGIRKSFSYIDEDRVELLKDIKLNTINNFTYFKCSSSMRANIYAIDKHLKSCGHLLSASERELLKLQKTTIVGRKFVVVRDRGFIFIAPYIKNTLAMSKEFKEKMRRLKIEPKLRGYLSLDEKVINHFLKTNPKYLSEENTNS